MNLMWFRNDLRVHDNPAFYASMQDEATIAVYSITQEQWQRHSMAAVRQDFIVRHIKTLQQDLAKLNVPLIVIDSGDYTKLLADIKVIISQYKIKHIFFNHEYEWNESQLSQLVSAKVSAMGAGVHSFHDQCLIEPGRILNKQGSFYKVFTAFKNEYLAQMNQKTRPVFPKPTKQAVIDTSNYLSQLDDIQLTALSGIDTQQLQLWRTLWPVGEDIALASLERFVEENIYQYHEMRDIPSVNGTSKLSAYLAIGAISVRQCFQTAVMVRNGLDNQGVKTWVVELIWRDFYRHLMSAFPEICRYKPFREHTDQLPWKQDPSLFQAWVEGRTGYPIVDAAMRQLSQTGWMHNRLRMVTAMFLTKHLFIDWRLGEQYFMSQLVDGDLASNNGGWQWSASTGVDAVPYFRIFNPTRQSQRFDKDGHFIRQYLPELAKLDSKSIHQPSKQQVLECGYVLPIVEHKTSVAQTKQYFKQLSDGPRDQDLREYGL